MVVYSEEAGQVGKVGTQVYCQVNRSRDIESAFREERYAQQQGIARLKVRMIDQWVQERVVDLQFLVTDGQSWFREERRDTLSEVHWLEDGVPAFRITSRDLAGRFTIEKIAR